MKKIVLRGDIDVNCYLMIDGNQCFIIDPGYEGERVQKFLKVNNLRPVGILITHGHIDHIGAVHNFNLPVYIHKKDKELIENDDKNGFTHFNKKMPYKISDIDFRYIDDQYELTLNSKSIQIIHTPGHTTGCVCYKFGNDLYTGDTLFKNAVGRWDFPTGDERQLKDSVKYLIENFPENLKIHPGHGASSTIGLEKQNNPYYKKWSASF